MSQCWVEYAKRGLHITQVTVNLVHESMMNQTQIRQVSIMLTFLCDLFTMFSFIWMHAKNVNHIAPAPGQNLDLSNTLIYSVVVCA